MSWTKTATNWNGTVADFLYLVLQTGNEVTAKSAAFTYTGIAQKRELGYLSQTTRPLGAWVKTPDFATDQTVTTTYNKRDLSVTKLMFLEDFCPNDWDEFWSIWQSFGTQTNLQINPQLLAAILDISNNNIGTHISELFWNGDTASGTPELAYFDGIIKLAKGDASVIDVPTLGAITSANVFEVLKDTWALIPNHLLNDPNFKIHMSTVDWKILQSANVDAKKTTTGVLSEGTEMFYLNTPIVHFDGIPAGHVVGANSSTSESSNLVMGFWVDPQAELNDIRIDRKYAYSEDWFMRMNLKYGVNYRYGGDIVLYQPV